MAKKKTESESKELAVSSVSEYALMKADPKKIADLLITNLGDDELGEFDLERIKFPSGTTPAFARTNESGTEVINCLEGVILYAGNRRVYWQKRQGEGESGGPPDCSSTDAKQGVGKIKGDDSSPEVGKIRRICKQCPMSQFGTGTDSAGKPTKGQACQQRKVLIMAVADSILPVCISLPPTSLKAYKEYAYALTAKGKDIRAVVTKISLEVVKVAGGNDYAKANLNFGDDLTPVEFEGIVAMVGTLQSVFSTVGIEPDDRPDGSTVQGVVVDHVPAPQGATVEGTVVD